VAEGAMRAELVKREKIIGVGKPETGKAIPRRGEAPPSGCTSMRRKRKIAFLKGGGKIK